MKDVISVDSNSKSEEHRCEECNSVCQNCNTAPEPPQDTSLDFIGCCGGGLARHEVCSHVKAYIKAQQAKLLQVIEDEVNKCEIDDHTVQTIFKHEVLLAIKKLKDNVINGGSL